MSKIKLTGDASGTGTLTIAAPNTDSDYSVTLPEVTGGEFVVTDSSGNVGIGTSSPSQLLHTKSSTASNYIRGEVTSNRYWQVGGAYGELYLQADAGNTQADSKMLFTIDGSEKMRIDSSGNLLVGTTTAISAGSTGVQIEPSTGQITTARNTTSTARQMEFLNPNGRVGGILMAGSSTTFETSSDYRLKENVVGMSGSIDRVKALKPSRFNFIADPDVTVDGFLAHEAQEVVPEAVSGTKDAVQLWEEDDELPEGVVVGDNKLDDDGNTIPDYQGIDQSKLVPLLTSALQEAIARIETLEAEVTALKGA